MSASRCADVRADVRADFRADVDVLVLGSGVAGLTAVLEVLRRSPGARVALATKGALGGGSTAWAQGGIAAVLTSDGPSATGDTVAAHVADTLAAGAGLCVPEAVAVLCAGGEDAVAALQRRGLVLDADGDRLARGLEAAHTHRRVVHAGGDTTGARLSGALVAAVRASTAEVLEDAALVDLLTDRGAVTGALLLGPGGLVSVRAAAVVLATGGPGQLYAHTTTPAVATGDGLAAAARAGALLTDLEMVQFHPTLAAVPGRRFLVSEAARGEGAVLRDEHGRRFLAQGPLAAEGAELAPRDVVARACSAVMATQEGRPVLLDATGVAARLGGRLAGRFPGIDALCREAGLDWAREPVPVTPAAHYAMGGVRTDTCGRSSLTGLWAVGEVAWTGVHGANRLASNSLLEAAVFAARAAGDVVATAGRDRTVSVRASRAHAGPWAAPGALPSDGGVLEVDIGGAALPRAELTALVWEHAGLVREEAGLEIAAKALAAGSAPDAGGVLGAVSGGSVSGGSVSGGAAGDGVVDGVQALEDANLTQLARLLVASARARRESRGAHWRADHPLRDEVARHTTVAVRP